MAVGLNQKKRGVGLDALTECHLCLVFGLLPERPMLCVQFPEHTAVCCASRTPCTLPSEQLETKTEALVSASGLDAMSKGCSVKH